MAKIYYGNGQCEIDTTDVAACEIRIKYPIEIDDKTPYEYVIMARNRKISIFVLRGKIKNNIKELFSYEGDLTITKATIFNSSGEQINCVLKKVMDYSELLNTTAETMTTKSEDLRATSLHKKRITKTRLVNPIIGDLKCGAGTFYLEDGTEYIGLFHVHHDTTQRMSGGEHTEESQNLYFKEEYEDKVIDKLILANSTNYSNTKERKIRSTVPHRRRRRK